MKPIEKPYHAVAGRALFFLAMADRAKLSAQAGPALMPSIPHHGVFSQRPGTARGLKREVLSPAPQLHVPAPEAPVTIVPQVASRLHNSVLSRVASANFSTEVLVMPTNGAAAGIIVSVWFSHARSSLLRVRPEVLLPPMGRPLHTVG